MNLFPVSKESIEKGAKILKEGGLVAFPTETVYGLGADAFNPKALAKIFEVKKRPFFDPLIIHISSIETLKEVTDLSLLNEETKDKLIILAENLWPGPLSIVLPKNKKIPGIATAGLQTAAIRFPDNETAVKLISFSTGAVAAPSANPFGSLSPTRAEHVLNSIGSNVDLILDGGPARIGIESTVIDITGKRIKILRPGGTPKEAIEKLIGQVESNVYNEQKTINKQSDNNKEQNFSSPGQLKSHYAPNKPLYILEREEMINQPYEKNNAYIFFDNTEKNIWLNNIEIKNPSVDLRGLTQKKNYKILSESGDVLEAASRLFEILHEIDKSEAEKIFAQLAPPHGLGEAINDRLRRGAVSNTYINNVINK